MKAKQSIKEATEIHIYVQCNYPIPVITTNHQSVAA